MNFGSVPLVSIGMPVYNCAATLEAAIRSIVNQTFVDWELLLVDDGSTDETLHVARSCADARIRVFSDGRHRGLAARLNQAIEVSRGKYFARMDGDDISYPERVLLQVRYLEEHTAVDLLGGRMLVFGRGGQVLGAQENRTTHEDICRRPWAGLRLAHPTWMGRMDWFRKHLYRSDTLRCEDQELLLRTYENSCFAALSEIVVGYREEELSLRKNLTGRRSFARCVVREAMPKRQYGIAAGVVIEQGLKGLTECVAIATGLRYSVLWNRALPVDEAAVRRWLEVWGQVQRGTGEAERFIASVGMH
jgi:glycosyltransferase involved in cell wall biosynthesis